MCAPHPRAHAHAQNSLLQRYLLGSRVDSHVHSPCLRPVEGVRAQWSSAVRHAKLEQAFYLASHRVIPFLDQFTSSYRVGWKLKRTPTRINDDSQRTTCDCN